MPLADTRLRRGIEMFYIYYFLFPLLVPLLGLFIIYIRNILLRVFIYLFTVCLSIFYILIVFIGMGWSGTNDNVSLFFFVSMMFLKLMVLVVVPFTVFTKNKRFGLISISALGLLMLEMQILWFVVLHFSNFTYSQ